MTRWKVDFRLDDRKDIERWLYFELIPELKRTRDFVDVIRDGLCLVVDLRAGRTDVLFELFPWVKDIVTPTPPTNNNDEVLQELIQLKEMIRQGQHLPPPEGPLVAQPALKDGPGAIREMAVPQFSLPRFEDDDQETVVIKRDERTDASANFLAAMKALQQ